MLIHPFKPVCNEDSEFLILGTFPSVKSRENEFYYGHPQNRFWKVLSEVFESPLPVSVNEKKSFLIKNKIALWDVIASCEIEGSSDSKIRNPVPNDISSLISKTKIKKIILNGNKAFELYIKFINTSSDIPLLKLPSTSPANASWSLDRLVLEWKKIL